MAEKKILTRHLSETIGTLVSRLTYPVVIQYAKPRAPVLASKFPVKVVDHSKVLHVALKAYPESVRIPARGKTKSDIIRGLLPVKPGTTTLDLPAGVIFVPNKTA
jgi:hypothetical protein